MDDGDECFDLDLEYASDFGAPTDHSSGEAVVMIPRVFVGPNPVSVRFPLRLGLRESRTRVADSRATPRLDRRREFARNPIGQDIAKPSRPR